MIEKAVRERLITDGPVAGLVKKRVYSGVMPQRPTFPLVTLQKVDKVSGLTLDGVPGNNRVRVQVDCWDGTVDGVRALAEAVNGDDSQTKAGPLHGFAGVAGDERVRLIELLVERSTEYESDTKLFRVGADYMVHL